MFCSVKKTVTFILILCLLILVTACSKKNSQVNMSSNLNKTEEQSVSSMPDSKAEPEVKQTENSSQPSETSSEKKPESKTSTEVNKNQSSKPSQSSSSNQTTNTKPVENTTPTSSTTNLDLVKIGYSEAQVKSIMGNPSNINNTNYPLYVFNYGRSAIFLLDGKESLNVIGWWNMDGNLKVTTGDKNSSAPTFTLGSTKDDVARAMGSPKIYDPYYYLSQGRWTYWEYPNGSRVDFDGNFKVIGWTNKGSLNVTLGTKNPNAAAIKLGSTITQVAALMGTPTALQTSSITNKPAGMSYGNCGITLDKNGCVTGWSNKGSYNFNIGNIDPSAQPIVVGSTFEDVIKAMGTPDSLTSSSFNDKPYMLQYGGSYIYVNDITQKVESWKDVGNLKVIK